MKSEIVPVTDLDDGALRERLKADGLRLTPKEARQVQGNIGRNPSRLEAVLFDTLWSEHCSYKSSRQVLKALPTEAPHVILGPGEDAGVVYLATHEGERWGLVVAHESHNHPSQIVPAEGAATGIGGVVRDVYCMGAEVVGVLDALRFGDPGKPECREIAAGVVDGIWHYGNALGVPNLGGDTVFHEDFSENCLVNVVALGIVPIKRLVRSRVPKEAKETPYVFILVGKPTDASGFGGASFASAVLDEEEESANKGAVQLPDPFLKRVLSEANRAVLDMAAEEGFALGFKDLGAGGIACATSELASAGGFGADIELGAVSIDGEFFPPEVIACSETQERYCLAVPQEYAQPILQIYNVDYELPHLYPGARAQVVGSVRAQDTIYRITHQGDEVCHLPVELITEGIRYDREVGEVAEPGVEHAPPEPDNYEALLKELMTGPSQGSRSQIYRMYDTEVQGRAVIRPGEADAAVIAPIPGNPVGLAVSVDGNPNYGKIDAYQGGASSVAESMRNVAAVGATPWCLTDCLNYGNPEDPKVFRQFKDGVQGVADAARGIGMIGEDNVPIPIVSGNVSFYNEATGGKAVPPSPIVACFGVMEDYANALTMGLKSEGNRILLLGRRMRELGGSAYWRLLRRDHGAVPQVSFRNVRAEISTLLRANQEGWLASAHDISEGGVLVAVAEMALAGREGCRLEIEEALAGLRADEFLFSETGGFLVEVPEEHVASVMSLAAKHDVSVVSLGEVTRDPVLEVSAKGHSLLRMDIQELKPEWEDALQEVMA